MRPRSTIASRVLDELRRSSVAVDDDQLAKRLGVSPRQTINQVCRRLEKEGALRRYVGSDGKIVNELTKPPGGQVAEPGQATVEHVRSAGDSHVQRMAERIALDQLGEQWGTPLAPAKFALAEGVRVEVDGVDDERTVLVEVWAHKGVPKSAQKHKVLADVLKLLHLAGTLPTKPRLVLCFCDEVAARHFTSARSWAAHALAGFGVEVVVVTLPPELVADIVAAQVRQYR